MAMGFLLRGRARTGTKLAVGVCSIPPSHRDYLRRHHEVEGWIEHAAAHVIAYLIALQTANGISGNMMEIGVHHGRLFILLALGCQFGETSLAVDLFERQHLNSSRSGQGDCARLIANLEQYAPSAPYTLVTADSTTLGRSFIRNHRHLRFVSIDGGHNRDTTCKDLFLAQRMLAPAGWSRSTISTGLIGAVSLQDCMTITGAAVSWRRLRSSRIKCCLLPRPNIPPLTAKDLRRHFLSCAGQRGRRSSFASTTY